MNPPLADRYGSAREPARLNDRTGRPVPEVEIQARLFNGEFGTIFHTTESTRVEILHFGEWNREAGPDFKAATLRFNDDTPVRGDLEVDWSARDWERHGHATNSAYENVALHLFIEDSGIAAFARTPEHRAIPQARLDIETRAKPFAATHGNSLDLPEAKIMIEAAAEFRLRRKHAAIANAVALHGRAAALFHGVATCLGYKDNSVPFLLAAQRTGLNRAADLQGEALLFGLAGFLEPRSFDNADSITRTYLKPLWDHWWTVRDSFSRLVIPRTSWKLSGVRPQNHPHRRMGALAAVASAFPGLLKVVGDGDLKRIAEFLTSLQHPYWSRHWNLLAAPLERGMALIGTDRATDILINMVVPSLPIEKALDGLKSLRGPFPGGRVRRACEWLTGYFAPELAHSALDQQGLLQLHADFGHLSPAEAQERILP